MKMIKISVLFVIIIFCGVKDVMAKEKWILGLHNYAGAEKFFSKPLVQKIEKTGEIIITWKKPVLDKEEFYEIKDEDIVGYFVGITNGNIPLKWDNDNKIVKLIPNSEVKFVKELGIKLTLNENEKYNITIFMLIRYSDAFVKGQFGGRVAVSQYPVIKIIPKEIKEKYLDKENYKEIPIKKLTLKDLVTNWQKYYGLPIELNVQVMDYTDDVLNNRLLIGFPRKKGSTHYISDKTGALRRASNEDNLVPRTNIKWPWPGNIVTTEVELIGVGNIPESFSSYFDTVFGKVKK